jgi:type I restriction enzyme M protein
MIALPGQLFYTTTIPVCLWFLTKNKTEVKSREGVVERRNREGETLFIDARQMGSMITKTNKELTNDDLVKIAGTYHAWRGEEKDGSGKLEKYEDIAGYSKSASLEDIKANEYVLTPGRYVGAAELEDDGIPFEVKMKS